MINFTHKPCNPDGKNSAKISQRMKNRNEQQKSNPLKSLLKYQLGTKQIKAVRLSAVHGFPRLKRKKIASKIFFGTFQLKMSRSYLGELIRKDEAYIVSKNILNSLEDKTIRNFVSNGSQIIAAIVNSRHRRGQIKNKNGSNYKKFRNTYKVFILYRPNLISSQAIQGEFFN